MQLNETQRRIFDDRYALRNSKGEQIETEPEQAWQRVASFIANDEEETQQFYNILDGFKFVPGGRIMAGAGAEKEKTFYNCYVIPVEPLEAVRNAARKPIGNDSREAIMGTVQTMVDIMSRGGGVGINWSVLRPQGQYLTRVSGSASGPVGWMDVASTAVGEVEQGGSRRGAAMFMLDDWHPDLLRFIDEKREKGKIKNANVSVAVSDRFMEAVDQDGEWLFEFPDTTDPQYNTVWDGDLARWKENDGAVVVHRRVPARDIWNRIINAAHASGEPGVVFLDRYNALSTASDIERIISVNPCGEQGLGAYSVCNLGSMNLKAYLWTHSDNDGTNRRSKFKWEWFEKDVKTSIRFLDNVIDKTYYFLRQTEEQQRKLRRIGLGVMGLADALILLGLRYGSPEAVEFTERIFQVMKDAAIEESNRLAKEKGAANGWKSSMWDRPYLAEYIDRKGYPDDMHFGMRNLFLLTQAPTGTTSMWANVYSGIEPYFQFGYTRHDRTGQHYVRATIIDELNLPEASALPDYLVTASEVTVEQHIAMQAGAQKSIDSSVSKTINAPNDQTVEEVDKAYKLAYTSGLKGLAYYRDGSRTEQVLYKEDPNEVIARLTKEIADLKAKQAWKDKINPIIDWNTYPPFAPAIADSGDIPFPLAPAYTSETCPVCAAPVAYMEGCKQCAACEWSAC